MKYQLGQVQMTGEGWGFNIVNAHRAPVVSFCYRDQTDAAKAQILIEEAIADATKLLVFSTMHGEIGMCGS